MFTTVLATFISLLAVGVGIDARPAPLPYLGEASVSLAMRSSDLGLGARDVYDPPIESPSSDTVWYVGQQTTVTWDASVIPSGQQYTGKLVLGYSTYQNENLDLDSPLAQNFSLNAGSVQITVPNVPYRTNYIVCLFGDSGNISQNFTITSAATSTTSTAQGASSPALSQSSTSSSSEAPTTTPGTSSSSQTTSTAYPETTTAQSTHVESSTSTVLEPTTSSSESTSASTTVSTVIATTVEATTTTSSAASASSSVSRSAAVSSSAPATSTAATSSAATNIMLSKMAATFALGAAVFALIH